MPPSEHPSSREKKGTATVLVLCAVAMVSSAIESQTKQRVQGVMEPVDTAPSSGTPLPTRTKPETTPRTVPAFPSSPPERKPLAVPTPDDPLPTLGSGDVNLGQVLAAVSECGIWEECGIHACYDCDEQMNVRPLRCRSKEGWLYIDVDHDTRTLGFSSRYDGAPDHFTPTVRWSSDSRALCEQLRAYEDQRDGYMAFLTDEAGLYRSNRGEGRGTDGFDLRGIAWYGDGEQWRIMDSNPFSEDTVCPESVPNGKKIFSVVVDGQLLRVTKWHLSTTIDGVSGAELHVAGIQNLMAETWVRAFHLDGQTPDALRADLTEVMDDLALTSCP